MTRTCDARSSARSAVLVLFDGASAAAEPVTSTSSKFAFGPKEITCRAGATVVWVNHDETPHTIAAARPRLRLEGARYGRRYEHTFDR